MLDEPPPVLEVRIAHRGPDYIPVLLRFREDHVVAVRKERASSVGRGHPDRFQVVAALHFPHEPPLLQQFHGVAYRAAAEYEAVR